MTKKKILIVDDDDDTLYGMTIRLRASGFDTACAADGVSALKIARLTRPDLIVLDIGLPENDGFLVMERLKSFPDLAEVPVVVVSARDRRANAERALALGALGFLEKPADNEDLLALAHRALRRPLEAPHIVGS